MEIGIELLNSGPFAPIVEGNEHMLTWKNGNRPIRITGSYITILCDIDCVMDCWAKVIAMPNNNLVDKVVWDKYASPSTVHGVWNKCNAELLQAARLMFYFMAKPIGKRIRGDLNYTVTNFWVHFSLDIKYEYLT